MRDFDEMLRGSFDAHAGEIDRAGGSGAGLAVRSVRDVRRKRAWRAGATGAVAATAAVGVVATALAFSAGGGATPAASPSSTGHGSEASPWYITDPYSLGPCTSFIPANGAVLPDRWYQGRAYVDPVARFVVAVMADGTATRVQPGPNGDFPFDFGSGQEALLPDYLSQTTYPRVEDYIGGGGGGSLWVDAQAATWQWTVATPEQAPAGVSVTKLYKVFTITLGFGGGNGYEPNSVPEGAVAETVSIYADGHEISGALVRDAPAPDPEDFDYVGLEAVALRVTLADGQTWEIRADYTPEHVPNLPCQPTAPSGVPIAPSPPEGTNEQALGDPLSGPESAVFQCGVPLPADLQDTQDVVARRATGDVSLGDADVFDVGDDGLVIEVTAPVWELDPQVTFMNTPPFPGWLPSGGSEGDEPFFGNLRFVGVVAVKDDVIAATMREPVSDWTAGGVGRSVTSYWDTGSVAGTQGFMSAYNGVHGLLQPCADGTSDALDGAGLAVIYGFGPDVDHITYGWTPVTN